MLVKRIIFTLILLISSCLPPEQKQKKVCILLVNEELVVLNGNVKRIEIEYDITTNPGQDYDIINLDNKSNMTKAVQGFHGMVINTYYITIYTVNDQKIETKGLI